MRNTHIKTIIKATPFLGIDGFYHYFYKIANVVNNMFYYGVHKTKNLEDGYGGSGYALKEAMLNEGVEHFQKEILCFFGNNDKMYEYEAEMVTKSTKDNPMCYNIKRGGSGGWDNCKGLVCVRDKNGKCFRTTVDDPRYASGEYSHNCKGLISVKFKTNGNVVTIPIDEFLSHRELYNTMVEGKVIASDNNGNISCIPKEDFDNGKYKGVTYGKGVYKDANGNVIQCDTSDDRVKSGLLVGYTKGLSVYKYKNDYTKVVQTTKDDPRVLSGELVGINYGLTYARDTQGNKYKVPVNDPRLVNGELIQSHRYFNLKKRGLI